MSYSLILNNGVEIKSDAVMTMGFAGFTPNPDFMREHRIRLSSMVGSDLVFRVSACDIVEIASKDAKNRGARVFVYNEEGAGEMIGAADPIMGFVPIV